MLVSVVAVGVLVLILCRGVDGDVADGGGVTTTLVWCRRC